MERRQLQTKIENFTQITNNEKKLIEINKKQITIKGTLITFESAALLTGSYNLVKNIPELSYRMTNEGSIQNILTVLGIGLSIIVIPTAIFLLKRHIPEISENIRTLNIQKMWLTRDTKILENAQMKLNNLNENTNYQKHL